jgi:hypothetical protein
VNLWDETKDAWESLEKSTARQAHIHELEQAMKEKRELIQTKQRLQKIFESIKFALDEQNNHVVMLGELDVEDYAFLYKQDIFPNHAFKTTRKV